MVGGGAVCGDEGDGMCAEKLSSASVKRGGETGVRGGRKKGEEGRKKTHW
jgi:hypothetical protein